MPNNGEHGITLQDVIAKAKKDYQFWCKLERGKEPDPRVIDHSHRFGYFIRFPYAGGINVWCFKTEALRDQFIGEYGGEVCHFDT